MAVSVFADLPILEHAYILVTTRRTLAMSSAKLRNRLFGTCAAAREVGCSTATLVNYEKRGIISPVRTESGHRIFTQADIDVARKQRQKHPV